jgi:hypothetical protein
VKRALSTLRDLLCCWVGFFRGRPRKLKRSRELMADIPNRPAEPLPEVQSVSEQAVFVRGRDHPSHKIPSVVPGAVEPETVEPMSEHGVFVRGRDQVPPK